MKRILVTIAAAALMYVPIGCVHQPVQAPIPGSINAFDSSAYQTLRTAHDIAQSLSDQACTNNGNKPGCFAPSDGQKAIVNQFIGDLNIADTIYAAYHSGAATQQQAQAALDKVTTDQSNLPIGVK